MLNLAKRPTLAAVILVISACSQFHQAVAQTSAGLGSICSLPDLVDCLEIPASDTHLCFDLFPGSPTPGTTGSYLAGSGSCALFTGTSCTGNQWLLATTITDFGGLSFNGETPLNTILSIVCGTG